MINYRILILFFVSGLVITASFSEFAFAKKGITVPDKVTGLEATAVSTSQIDLTWTAPDDGGSPITGYQIERKQGGWTVIVADTASTDTSYSDTGLDPDTRYLYRVSAINVIGVGSSSSPIIAATLTAATVPDAPSLLATPGDSHVILSWEEPYDGGSAILDYEIQISSNNGATWTVYEDGVGTDTQVTVTNLVNNHNYLFRVYTINSVGKSAASMSVSSMPTGSSSTGGKNVHTPNIMGMGFYTITTQNVKDPYSKILLETKIDETERFEDFIPYSKNSDVTDLKKYGSFEAYEKRGYYTLIADNTLFPTFSILPKESVQLQIRLKDDFASTTIEHLSLYTANQGNNDPKFSKIELSFNKGKPLQVKDPEGFIESVNANAFLEDEFYWINFDIVFEKPMEKSDIILETWNEFRTPVYATVFDAIEVTNQKKSESEPISLRVDVEMSHKTSSPVCKASATCFTPFNAQILKGGIVTWVNKDSFVHDVESGVPGKHDSRFDLHVMPGQSSQKVFKNSGVYKYFCSLHPWATGKVTVYDESGKPVAQEFDEEKPPLIVASTTSGGSLMVEQGDVVVLPNQNLNVEISGNVQEGKSKSVTIIIIHPDDTEDELSTATNDRGYYFLPTVLDKKWQPGDYQIIAKFKNNEIGKVTFSVTDKATKGFGGILVQTKSLVSDIKAYFEKTISFESLKETLTKKEFSQKAIKVIESRIKSFQIFD